ncbi:MAG: type III-B CRISPR module RAMP protein Cmr4 [Leptolyngbya foveolarum]|uniref:Type III-B CRISPR module RAMP protein Cmr4 n=1 Tax=Leptolyngbya foveolarum TaxID=47253 RepID=A0A2W4VMB0_9CYAN|nr:MAG: type III-B CRISPR module RAMP protein Cmr4 [Leptolyngbya foveolarum]
MNEYLTYLYLLTPLHTGGSADEGNLMGIAREVHTEFPYLPSSSLRGRIRAAMEKTATEGSPLSTDAAENFFGRKLKNGLPTEGEVWFADATLLFFPVASLSHHLVWMTCPLWLERWSRWLGDKAISQTILKCRKSLAGKERPAVSAVLNFDADTLYLQTAVLSKSEIGHFDTSSIKTALASVIDTSPIAEHLLEKIIVLSDENCISLVETGLQREVRVALKADTKTVDGGSFRSEEAIPPEAVLFFPWGTKAVKPFQPNSDVDTQANQAAKQTKDKNDQAARKAITELLHGQRLQFGGLEGLGRGWTSLITANQSEA